MDVSLSTSITNKQSKRTLPTASHTSYKSPFASRPQVDQYESNHKDNDDSEGISVDSSLATDDALEENCVQIFGTPHESTTRRLSSTRWNRLQTNPGDGVVFDRLYRHAVYKMELDRMPGEWKEELQSEGEVQKRNADDSASTTDRPRTLTRPSSDGRTVIVDLETCVSHRLEHANAVFAPPTTVFPRARFSTASTKAYAGSSKNTKGPRQHAHRRSPNTRYQQYSAAICIQKWWRSRPRSSVVVIGDDFFAAAHSVSTTKHHSYRAAYSSGSIRDEVATVVQAWWKMKVIQQDYRTLQWAVHTIQRHARQWRWNRAAQAIQAYFRGYTVRQQFGYLRASVILIQSAVRMFLIRCKIVDHYQLLQQRRLLVQYKRAVLQRDLLIQKRDVLRSRRTASVLIQSHWRRYQAMGMLESLRACCIILQSQMRGCLVRRSSRGGRQIRNAAAVCVQAHWRRYAAVEKYILLQQVVLENQRTAITLIQTQWRRYLAVRMYSLIMHMIHQSQQRAALVLQTKWRGYLALGRYDMIKQLHAHNWERSAVVIQSQWRSYLASRVYKMVQLLKRQSQERAAIKVQAQWRRYASIWMLDILKQVAIQHQRSAATFLQAQWRRYAASKMRTTLKLQKEQVAAVVIQFNWRRHQAIEMFECLKACIIIIQSQIRGYLVRSSIARIILTKPAYRHYQNVLTTGFDCAIAASIIIQRVVRGYMKRQKINKFRSWLSAAVAIQTKWRHFHAIKTFQHWRSCAILIQSYVRMYMAQRLQTTAPPGFAQFQGVLVTGFNRSNTACTHIQRVIRGYLVRHNFDLLQAGALQRILFRHDIIMSFPETYRWQCYWRTICVRDQFNLYGIENHALRLQCWWRMVPIQNHLQNLQILSVWLQAIIRGYICRKAIKRMRAAATIIQTSFRGWQSVRDFALLLWSASTVQNWWRQHRAATSIQSVFRMWINSPKRQCRQKSVVFLQKSFRQMLAKNALAKSRAAALMIQSTYRAYNLRYHLDFSRNTATKIQAGVRGWLALQHYHLLRGSLIVVQSYARKWITLRRYTRALQNKKIQSAAVLIQSLVRRSSSRQRYTTMRTSITFLQSHVRAWLIRDYYVCIKYELSHTITLIQSSVRSWLTMRRYKMLRTFVIVLQSWVRGSISRHKLQKLLLGTQQKRVTKMQAVARKCLAVGEASRRRAAILRVQSGARTLIARQAYLKAKLSLIKLQSHVRGWVERNKYKGVLAGTLMQKTAASVIQSIWRKSFRKMKCPQIIRTTAQTAETSLIWLPHTRVLAHLEQTVAATAIQSWFRRCHTRFLYKTFRGALVRVQKRFRLYSFGRARSVFFLQKVIRGIVCRRKTMQIRRYEEDCLLKSVLHVQTLLRSCFLCNSFLDIDALAVDLQQAVRRFEKRRQSLRYNMLSSIVTKQYMDWKLDASSFVLESAVILLQLCIQGDMPSIPALVSLGLIRERLYLKKLISSKTIESKQDSLSVARSSRLARAFCSAENSCCVMIQRLYRGYQARFEYEALRIASREDDRRQLPRSASLSVRVIEQLSDQRIRVEISADKHLVERHHAACVIQTAFLTWREHRRQMCLVVLQSLAKVKIYRNVYGETSKWFQPGSTPYLSGERVRQAHIDFQMPDTDVFSASACAPVNRLRVQLMDTMLVAVPFMAPLN